MLRSKAPDVYIQDTMDKKEADAFLRGRDQGYELGKADGIAEVYTVSVVDRVLFLKREEVN